MFRVCSLIKPNTLALSSLVSTVQSIRLRLTVVYVLIGLHILHYESITVPNISLCTKLSGANTWSKPFAIQKSSM